MVAFSGPCRGLVAGGELFTTFSIAISVVCSWLHQTIVNESLHIYILNKYLPTFTFIWPLLIFSVVAMYSVIGALGSGCGAAILKNNEKFILESQGCVVCSN
jgi:hypothetical protein